MPPILGQATPRSALRDTPRAGLVQSLPPSGRRSTAEAGGRRPRRRGAGRGCGHELWVVACDRYSRILHAVTLPHL